MAGNFNYFAVNQFQPQNVQQLMGQHRAMNAVVKVPTGAVAAATATSGANDAAMVTAAPYYNNPNIISQVQSIERAWLLQSTQATAGIVQQQQQQPATLPPGTTIVQHVQMAPQQQQQLLQEVAEAAPAPAAPPAKMVYRCPDCNKSFKHASGVYIHAAQIHYASSLQNAYWPEIELTSTCPICSKPIDKAKYLAHVGAKHKKIVLFMTPEKRDEYLNIEKQKLTAGRRRKKGVSSCGTESTVREDKFRCPDCDKPFAFVAPLYIHAATTHYGEQIKAKYVPVYREHGKCHLCGALVSQTSLVSHFGGKHRRILTFMDDEKRQVYMSMKKRTWTNFRELGGLSCAYEGCAKDFKNLTMYKQHLANTHVRTELLGQARSIKDARCNFCGKVMTKQYSLLQHLGTCHNQILNYVPPEVLRHLNQLGVKEPE